MKFGASVSPRSPSYLTKSNDVSSDKGEVIIVSKQCASMSPSKDKFNKISTVLNGHRKIDQRLLSGKLSGHLPHITQSNIYYDQISQLESKLDGQKTLGESESKTNTSLSLSVLSKAHDLRNKGVSAKPQTNVGVSLSDLAGFHLGKGALAGVGGDSQGSTQIAPKRGSCLVTLSSLSKSHGCSATSGIASSLSQLAEAHAAHSKCPAPGLSSVGMSLSQLAEAHGIAKPSLGLNPAKNKDNSIEEKAATFGFGKQKSASLLSSEMYKNKTDKAQIMLSLSSLIDKQGTIKNDESRVVIKQSASISSKTDTDRQGYDIHQQNASLCTQSKIGKQSAESTDIRSKLATLSLADLAKGRSPHNQKEMKSASKAITAKAKELLKEENGNDEMANESTTQYNKDMSDLEDLLDVKITLKDDVYIETVKHLMKRPSNFGSTLCLEISVRAKGSKQIKYKRKKFSCSLQMKDMKERLPVELKEIKAFDFSTPSPDDVVKAKQTQAFNRSGK